MKLTKEMEEKTVLGIQAVLGILVILMSVRNAARVQTKQMQKVMDKDAKRLGKLHKAQYRIKKKTLEQKYRRKFGKK